MCHLTRNTVRLGAITLTAVLASCAAPADTPPITGSSTTAREFVSVPVVTPVLAEVLAAPIAVPATDGRIHLAYELLLTNAGDQDVTVDSIQVNADDRPLLKLAGNQLAYWTRLAGGHNPTTTIGAGQLAKVWLDVGVDTKNAVPKHLSHTVVIAVSRPSPPLVPAVVTENVAGVDVSNRHPAVLSPPLYGPNWVDVNSCCDMTPHRMALNPIDGKLWGAERFAIDYLQLDGLDSDGSIFHGDKSTPRNYPYFGADIHAVADGPVVAVLDGLPEQVPEQTPTGLTLAQYGGNHVVQDIGDGNYAFYAHLQTGSVRAQLGAQLRTGQVIGRLGNSGNSDAPHLHFHVMSTPDPLRADGLPFVFRSFRLVGRLTSLAAADALETGPPAQLTPAFTTREENNVSPLVLDVMTYEK
jgi:Peptidase family M23